MATTEKTKTASHKASTPGEILKTEFMDAFGITIKDLAIDIDTEPKVLRAVIANKRPIDNELAQKLCATFGNGPQYWQRLSREYVENERRNSDRFSTEMQATISVEGKSLECLVNEISRTGARLMIQHADLMPEQFELTIKKTGKTFNCEARWRTDDEMGVMFLK